MTTFLNGVEQVAGAEVGGLYGINVEELTGAKTLTPGTDKIYQYLDTNLSNRIITLDTASATAGDRFIIRNMALYNEANYLQVKQAAIILDYIYAAGIKEFIFDGTNWITGEFGTGEDNNRKWNLAIGYYSRANDRGTAIGWDTKGQSRGVSVGRGADSYSDGAALGYGALGNDYGVALGYSAQGRNRGVAIGYRANTNSERFSIALGYYSKTIRAGETSINIDGNTLWKNNVVQGRWSKTTTDDTPIEIHLAGYSTERFTIRAKSHLAFKMTIVARDDVANEGAMYTFEGLIKRDASNNTVLSVVNKIVVYEDDAGWDVAVTANDANETLKIEVTGDASNPVQWAVRMDGVETHF